MNEIEQLLERALETVRRDLVNINLEGMGKKLKPPAARDLVAYVKLLSEVQKEQERSTDQLTHLILKLTDEQKKELANSLLNGDKPNKA